MGQKKKRKCRGVKIFQIILISIIFPITLIVIMSVSIGYSIEKRELIATISERNMTDAMEKSSAVNSLFGSMQGSVAEISAQLSNVPITAEDTLTHVHMLLKLNNFFDCSHVIDAEDRVVQAVKITVSPSGELVLSQDSDINQKKSPALPFTADDQHIVTVSAPIYDANGVHQGYLEGALTFDGTNALQDILKTEVSDLTHSYTYVVNAEKRIVYHPDQHRFMETMENNVVVDRVNAGQSGISTVTNSQGEQFIAGYAYVKDLGWGIITQTPISYINERATNLTQRMLLIALPCVIVIIGLTICIAAKFIRPIKQVMSFMGSYLAKEGAAEDLSTIRSRWNYETNRLVELLSVMLKEAEEENTRLIQEAVTDPLTGLLNRRDIDLSETVHGPYAVVLIDIDHFKHINDTYGHLKGDEVIVALARVLQRVKREQDIFCRYGGEEFLLLLPNTTESAAYLLAEGIRYIVEKSTSFSFDNSVTISGGISSIQHGHAYLEVMVEAADQALYSAKSNGRNRIMINC